MRERRVLLAVMAVAVAAAIAAGAIAIGSRGGSDKASQPKDDPVVFLRGVVAQIVRNDYAHAWSTLHPAQQRVVSKRDYVRCELQTKIIGRLDSLTLVRSFDDFVLVAGGGVRPVKSRVATFRLRLSEPGVGVVTFTHSVHAIAVGGQWKWILTPHRYELYRLGGCSQAPPPAAPS